MVAAGPHRSLGTADRGEAIGPEIDPLAAPPERNGTRPRPPPKQWAVITKVLIANRGEIAVRVIRACQELGITSVAVYSDLDRDCPARPTRRRGLRARRQTAAESYLNTESHPRVIERRGAEAVHPGYGFFSENTDFARAITERGRGVHRPAARGHRGHGRQGLEPHRRPGGRRARRARHHRVPRARPTEVVAFGEEHGWPVAIKAAYGGGGRGMRVVNSADEAESRPSSPRSARRSRASAATSATSSATSPGPATSRCRSSPTQHGNVVWVGERDCSAQRRHQKLIEESPAPAFPAEIRQAMGEAAVKVAKACGYVNAGTVEFLYQDGEFFFLEMNTRLQVEHPVTELVIGHRPRRRADPRRLRRAALVHPGRDRRSRGHAIEVRINAEDPGRRQVPPVARPHHHARARRRLRRALGRRLRGRRRGQPVLRQPRRQAHRVGQGPPDRPSPACSGRSREFRIDGITTTIPADLAILEHPDFAGGQALDQVGRGRARPHRRGRRARRRRRPPRARSPSRRSSATSTSRSTASGSR